VETPSSQGPENASSSLGDVLYAGKAMPIVSETEWVELVRAVAAGSQPALHGLYERAHRPVYTLIVRIMANREAAEELTLDVFHDIWRRAGRYDSANGTVLGWIMNQARSRALDRLRFDRRQKRVLPDGEDPLPGADTASDPADRVAFRQQSLALGRALAELTVDERVTIQTTFFAELTHAEAALRLNQPLGTVKTRIRSALHKLRHALNGGARKA
jgi:RNA polymerase sigma-70 factor (ECF subfamily)